MDILNGLTAIGKAIEIAEGLRNFDKKLSEATIKNEIADLYTSLADAKMALVESRLALQDNANEIIELERLLKEAQSGKVCEMCRTGAIELVKTEPHPDSQMADIGVINRTYGCSNSDCSFTETKLITPGTK